MTIINFTADAETTLQKLAVRINIELILLLWMISVTKKIGANMQTQHSLK